MAGAGQVTGAAATRLSGCGLLEAQAVTSVKATEDSGNQYHVTPLGRQFVSAILAPLRTSCRGHASAPN